jgi:hypothetical protein
MTKRLFRHGLRVDNSYALASVRRWWITSSLAASSVESSSSTFFTSSDGRISRQTRMMRSLPGGWTHERG